MSSSNEQRVFLDECGYTGPDLLNNDQPVFVLASLNLGNQDASDLKRKYFGKVQARELKHSALSGRPVQQKMVLAFLRDLAARPNSYKLSVALKPYVLVAKLIDLVVEPLMREHGINVYERGVNIATANVYFTCLPAFMGKDGFYNLLRSFQYLVIHRTPESYDAFVEQLELGMNAGEEAEHLISTVLASLLSFENRIFNQLDPHDLDIAVSLTLEMLSQWHDEVQQPLTLVHDKSGDMAAAKHVWGALANTQTAPVIAGYDRRRIKLPIPVKETLAEDSQHWDGLQLADVLAGAVGRACRWQLSGNAIEDTYGKELWGFVQEAVQANQVWPSTGVTPGELGTTGPNAMDPEEAIRKLLDEHRTDS